MRLSIPQAKQLLPHGTQRPAVIVPLISTDTKELLAKAQKIGKSGLADIIEWRVDHLFPETSSYLGDDLIRSIGQLGREIGNKSGLPILATVRTWEQGGNAALPATLYAAVLKALSENCAGIDVELTAAVTVRDAVVRHAREQNCLVVMSYHDFQLQPGRAEIMNILGRMRYAGADVLKVAFTPNTAAELAELFHLTADAANRDWALIVVAMGPLGVLSRVGGGVFGSGATFAAWQGQVSAHGQIDAKALREIWDRLGW